MRLHRGTARFEFRLVIRLRNKVRGQKETFAYRILAHWHTRMLVLSRFSAGGWQSGIINRPVSETHLGNNEGIHSIRSSAWKQQGGYRIKNGVEISSAGFNDYSSSSSQRDISSSFVCLIIFFQLLKELKGQKGEARVSKLGRSTRQWKRLRNF